MALPGTGNSTRELHPSGHHTDTHSSTAAWNSAAATTTFALNSDNIKAQNGKQREGQKLDLTCHIKGCFPLVTPCPPHSCWEPLPPCHVPSWTEPEPDSQQLLGVAQTSARCSQPAQLHLLQPEGEEALRKFVPPQAPKTRPINDIIPGAFRRGPRTVLGCEQMCFSPRAAAQALLFSCPAGTT